MMWGNAYGGSATFPIEGGYLALAVDVLISGPASFIASMLGPEPQGRWETHSSGVLPDNLYEDFVLSS